MKDSIATLLKHLDRGKIERDVDEELRFHIEAVTHEYIRQGLSPTEAKARTLKRFGNVGEVKNECVRIRRRSHPFQRFTKASLILVALAGLAIHFMSADDGIKHIGDTLILVAVAGRLLLYARGLTPATFLPKNKTRFSLFTSTGPDARN